MKLLITGGSGMVGNNLLEHSASSDYQIIAPSSSRLNLLSEIDVSNFFAVERVDAVIHCAGVVGGIQANISEPVRYFSENMQMALNIINGAKKAGVKKFLNLGSSCMYPRNAVNPLKEEAILTGELEPTNEGYALAKISAARLCEYISRENNGYFYKTIIPCNLYGRHDKFDQHSAHMIPAVVAKIDMAIKYSKDEVSVWGDGETRREFMYAGDLADFIYFALPKFEKLPALLNIGVGHDYTINEYYQVVAKVLDFRGCFVHDLSKPVGMRQKLIDVQKLHAFGWHAKTCLNDGIQKTHEFYMGQQSND